MPILCFGGSFNPIHNGHLRCAEAVATKAGYDKVLLIPSAQPPHKPDAPDLAPAEDRLAMARLAAPLAEGVPFEVSDVETRRGGPSFTIDTAQELRDQGINPVHWLIGADMLLYLPKWHRWRALPPPLPLPVLPPPRSPPPRGTRAPGRTPL